MRGCLIVSSQERSRSYDASLRRDCDPPKTPENTVVPIHKRQTGIYSSDPALLGRSHAHVDVRCSIDNEPQHTALGLAGRFRCKRVSLGTLMIVFPRIIHDHDHASDALTSCGICKAADYGYKVIILLAGMHNNLRSQTQRRVDSSSAGRSRQVSSDAGRLLPPLSSGWAYIRLSGEFFWNMVIALCPKSKIKSDAAIRPTVSGHCSWG